MLGSVAARQSYRHPALVLALLAMAMLFAGPLISQSQAHEPHHGAQHDGAMTHGAHDMHGERPAHGESAEAALTWFDQCGYCTVWQHFPAAHVHLPAMVRDALQPLDTLPFAPVALLAEAPIFPHARSRAPPRLS